jgi:hypothetical protein
LILWGDFNAARRAQARLAVGQNEVRSCAILKFCLICFAKQNEFLL